nr:DUF5691 domain-containing protein [Streptomyces sp. Ru73]
MSDVRGVSGQSAPWGELVSAALLGTERRTPDVPVRAGQEPAAALLDAAAVSTVRRRAGLRPAPAAERPSPAPPDPRPELPDAARRRLALLLADRGGGAGSRRGAAPDLTELLPQWLAVAGERGYRAPAALLPALLDAARARTDLRPAALELAGPRALWLARLNDDWKFALRGIGGAAAIPARRDPEASRRLWEEGLFAERVALLSATRRLDPAAGLALLASTWSTERAEDRLMFLDSLREGLSSADEPFLEKALSDRSRNVRATAAELLSALPVSALASRMAERAAACLRLETAEPASEDGSGAGGGAGPDTGETAPGPHDPALAHDPVSVPAPARVPDAAPVHEPALVPGPVLVVEAPRVCDAGMERDGVVAKAPAGRGERAWWLAQLLEAAPAGGVAGAAGRPEPGGDRGAARGRRAAYGGARRLVPGGGAAARRGLGPRPARLSARGSRADRRRAEPPSPEHRRTGRGGRFVAGHGEAARGAAGGRTRGVGRGVHRGARAVGRVPAAGGVCRAVGRAARHGGGGRAGHRAGRRELPVELQRGDGARRAVPGPGCRRPARPAHGPG